MTIGDRIRAIRKEKGLTQKELAEKLGVSSSMIGQYETNVRNPKIETLKNIASALGVHLTELIDVDVSHISLSLNAALPLAENVFDILSKSPPNEKIKLTDEERTQVRDLVKYLGNVCTEMETSSFLNNAFLEEYISYFDKLNLNGKYLAIKAVSNLAQNPELRADHEQ